MHLITQTARPKVYLFLGDNRDSAVDLSPYAISLSASSAVNQAAGSWSVTLAPYQVEGSTLANIQRIEERYRSIRPNQVVSLGVDEDGGIMLGLVGKVDRSVSHGGAQASVSLTISGACTGKVLQQDHIIRASLTVGEMPDFVKKVSQELGANNPVIADLPAIWAPISEGGVPTFLGATVAEAVSWLVDTAPSMRVPLLRTAIGGTGEPREWLNPDQEITTWNTGRIWSENPSSYQGDLWGFVTSLIDQDFYDAWVETVPTGDILPQVRIVVRPKPYDDPDFEWLPVAEQPGLTWPELVTRIDRKPNHEIELFEVLRESFSYGDSGEVWSYYTVTSQFDIIANAETEARGLFYPCLDLWAAKTFGIRAYETHLSLVGADLARKTIADAEYTETCGAEIKEFRNRLVNWYRLNSFYESGSVTVAGRDRYRPGDPVLLPWRVAPRGAELGLRYYCTAVSWSWSFGAPYTCTLQLIRGQNPTMLREIFAEIRAGASDPVGNPDRLAEV